MKKILSKKIILLFYLLILSGAAVSLLLNCSSDKSGPTTTTGFTPNSPTTDNSEGESEYYDPSLGRGSSSQHSTGTGSGSSSGSIAENEAKWGTSAPITITNSLTFEDFRLGVPVNSMKDIQNLRVYVKLGKVSRQKYYAGRVTIAYEDYGREKPFRSISFHSGNGANAQYNVWLKKTKFHGFFQENNGALILVINRITSVRPNPDAPPVMSYGGSIWTMQFRTTFGGRNSCNNHDQKYVFQYNQNPPGGELIPTLSERNKKCWFLTIGPFDCRTWRKGKGVNTFKAVEPDDRCYSKLGTFEGLDIPKAFGVSAISNLATY